MTCTFGLLLKKACRERSLEGTSATLSRGPRGSNEEEDTSVQIALRNLEGFYMTGDTQRGWWTQEERGGADKKVGT